MSAVWKWSAGFYFILLNHRADVEGECVLFLYKLVQGWMVGRVSLHSICGLVPIEEVEGPDFFYGVQVEQGRNGQKGTILESYLFHSSLAGESSYFLVFLFVSLGVFWLWVSLLPRLGYVGDENKNPKELTFR